VNCFKKKLLGWSVERSKGVRLFHEEGNSDFSPLLYDTKTKGIDFPIAMSTSILRAMKLYEYECE
jgi:hypothetical protein